MLINKKKPKRCNLFDTLKRKEIYFSISFLVLAISIMVIQIVIENMIITADNSSKINSVSSAAEVKTNSNLLIVARNPHKEVYLENFYDEITIEEDIQQKPFEYPLSLQTDRYMLIDMTSFEVDLEIDAEIEEEHVLVALELDVDSEFTYYTTYRDYNNGNVKTLPMSERGQKITYMMAKKYGLPYETVLAILGVETHWNEDPNLIARSVYVGIGCINKNYHAKRLADKGIDIYTLEGNIEGICYILKESRDIFNGNLTYAIMGYNGGNGYARGKKEDGITETGYTKKVDWYVNSFE